MAPTAEASAQSARRPPAPDLETIRAAFPQLEILEFIGQGGMGAVYKARQPLLHRLVALKILTPPTGSDPRFAERFQREAQALARLDHPNIVTIHDFGQSGPFFYLIMEYVDGVNLRHAMRAGRFTPSEALAIVPPICEALQRAHDQGIVHRDIKPENVLLNKAGVVKIADFGIARIVGAEPTMVSATHPGCEPNLTAEAALGTPQYMAPEQSSRPAEVDHRADIYSLGVVLYELLTGELPSSRLEPPSRKVQVDVRLDEVVLRALNTNPLLRYSTAIEFKTDVESFTNGGSVTTPRSSQETLSPQIAPPKESERRPVRRRVGRTLAVMAAVILLLIGVIWWLSSPVYRASVTMEVHPDHEDTKHTTMSSAEHNKFVRTQQQVMMKKEILYPVIENLELETRLSKTNRPASKEDIYVSLVRALELRPVGDTDLVVLSIYYRDPQIAAEVANGIARSYTERRLRDISNSQMVSRVQLQDELAKQREQTQECAMELTKLREAGQIIDPNPERLDSMLNSSGLNDPAKTEAIAKYVDTKARYLQSKKILDAAQAKYATLKLDSALFTTPVKIWEKAEAPSKPVRLEIGAFRW